MKLLKNLHEYNNFKKNEYPELKLVEPYLFVDELNKKPYFLISPLVTYSVSKLYTDVFLKNKSVYVKRFSIEDFGTIMFCIGGMQAMELNSTYHIKTINLEDQTIEVLHKCSCNIETWRITDSIVKSQYELLDKKSILQLGFIYSEIQEKNTAQILSLRVVK